MSASPVCRHLPSMAAVRALMFGATLVVLLSCGGGGGGAPPPPPPERLAGVYSGFPASGDLDWTLAGGTGGDGGVGGGADGDGGVGAGGDFGQFRNALIIVKYPDGTPLGEARTDADTGMVTIVPRKGYRGPLYLELRGGDGATYYEEGKDTFVDFPAGQVIRAMVPEINKNIGITPFSEAAYRLLTEGSTAERASNSSQPTAAEIAGANAKVLGILNHHVPATLQVDDITRLPFIKSPTIGEGSIGIDARGRYGLVNGAFSKQAAMFNQGRAQPTLDAVGQLGTDLLDGMLDGMNGNLPAGAAAVRTYDPNTLTGELSSALAEQSYRFGTDVAKGALPKVVNFANSRYAGYLFDASISAEGKAVDTVSGWVSDNAKNFSIGQANAKLVTVPRVFAVFGNFGHGALFFKTDAKNSQSKIFAIGDNVNGELGLGNNTPTDGATVEVALPGALTHAAGGHAHTVARMADGSVYAWGDNAFGQLGNGSTAASTTPMPVALPRGAIAVAATNTASYALLDDGSVYAWGSSGGFGLLGDGEKNSARLTPSPISALSNVVQITARDNDVAVVRKDGSVLHWGSFPADEDALKPGRFDLAYEGGTPLPTPLVGLPAGAQIRKVLSEQGLFAVLLADGSVYEWGVYFDITAGGILRDIQAQRVLSLPPVRDIMPGGYIGYGVRPFDRLTAMGVDYRGGMWKIRGRVAEEFDPANPTLQRRPQGQGPRKDCASCHIVLNDWPLTPAPATTTTECVPPTSIHGGGAGGASLIHAETACQKCHNPNRQPPAAMFPNGWLTCVKPPNLPPRINPVAPPIISAACTLPVGHSFTPQGTVCASCHNSIIARPLQELGCAQPSSNALPTIPTTATIVTAVTDGGGTIASGSLTTDTTPELRGSIAATLAAGQLVTVMRNGTPIGTALPSGTSWSFVDARAPNGTVVYTARVGTSAGFGPTSNAYRISIDTVTPTITADVTAITDDVLGAIAAGGFASDTTPTVNGTLGAPLASGESVQVLRDGAALAGATRVSGTNWSYTEGSPVSAGRHSYQARVIDAANNQGPLGASRSVVIITSMSVTTITGAVDDRANSIKPGGSTADNTPTLSGTVSPPLPAGHVLRVMRNGTAIGAASGNGAWTFTDPGAPGGLQSYTVRSEAGAVLGALSGAYAFTIDSTPPTQVAHVTRIVDDDFIRGPVPPNGTTRDVTPQVEGTLDAPLAGGEVLRVTRCTSPAPCATVAAQLTPTGIDWSFPELKVLPDGTYTYSAQVIDASNLAGPATGTKATVTITTVGAPLSDAPITRFIVNGTDVPPAGVTLPPTKNMTVGLSGEIGRELRVGERVRIYLDAASYADANVSGKNWNHSSAVPKDGTYAYRVQVEQTADPTRNFGPTSGTGRVRIDATAPTQTASVTQIGNLLNGGNTADTTLTVRGTVDAGLAAGESLQLQRNNVAIATPVVAADRSWSFTDAVGAGPYTYSAFVVDLAGNTGTVGATRSVNVFTNLVAARITSIGGQSSGGISNSNTIVGTVSTALPAGQSVKVYRGGNVALGTATFDSATSWSLTPAVADGTYTYTARTENGTAFGEFSASFSHTIDTTPPPAPTVSGLVNNKPFQNNTEDKPVQFGDRETVGDPDPQIVVLFAALGSNERVEVRDGSGKLLQTISTVGATSAATINHATQIDRPDTAPSSSAPATVSYTATRFDAASNSRSTTLTFTIDYLECSQVRAMSKVQTEGHAHTVAANWLPASGNGACVSCHRATNGSGFVAAPPPTSIDRYWCRKP